MKTKENRISGYASNDILKNRSAKRGILIRGLLSTIFFVALFAFNPTLLQKFDFMNYDLLLRNFPDNYASSRLLIVDLDEKSLNRYGQWPWPRYRVAELFDKIAAMEPAAVGIDIIFAEPDRTSAGHLLKDLGNAYNLDIAVDLLPAELRDNDLILAEALSGGPFVLSNKFHFNSFEKASEQCLLHPVNFSLLKNSTQQRDNLEIPESTGVLCNLKILSEKAVSSGFSNYSPDQDGLLRRLPLLIKYNGELYASLALATILKAKGADNLLLKENRTNLQFISYNGTSIPVDPHGQLLIKFRGQKNNYEYVSAADIMDNSVSSEHVEGRIVLVGTTAVGLKELRATPLNPITPGIEVHAAVADNLLSGDFISVPGYCKALIIVLVLVSGVLLSIFTGYRNAASSLIVTLVLIAGLWLGTQQVFFRTGLFIGTAFPVASILCIYIFLTIQKYRLEYYREKRALKQSEARFRKLFKKAPIPMCHISMDGKILDVNEHLTESMGYTTHDLPALEHAWHHSIPDPELGKKKMSKGGSYPETSISDNSALESSECQVLFKDGNFRNMVVSTKLIGDSIIVSFFDITELRNAEKEREKLQSQLYQSQKLEAVGILVGGIAHDFNNMLGAIMGYTELTMNVMDRKDPSRRNLERILDTAQHSSNLTRQLLAFASKQNIAPVVLDFNAAVEAMLKMLRQLIHENIDLDWIPGKNPCTVIMDPGQFDQILVNLCVNAGDAISDVGRICIETDAVSLGGSYCDSRTEIVPGNYVLLSVSDNGCGMDKDTLDHIFEPFFTTKEVGQGTGMGLATVYGIVKQNKGFINVYSEPGKGTTFKIFIPLNPAETATTRLESNDNIPRSRGETILVVEDDPTILEMTVMMLQKLGYSVLAAGTPNDAIRIAKENSSEIHLLLTDMIMPEMNGRALSEQIQKIRSNIKYLFMSGYTSNVIDHQGVLDKGINFISKPFMMKDIAAKVREILD